MHLFIVHYSHRALESKYRKRGYSILYESRIEEAKAQLDILADGVAKFPEIALLRARILHYLGELDEAKASVEDYMKRQPNNTEALGGLALLHFDMSEFEATEQ